MKMTGKKMSTIVAAAYIDIKLAENTGFVNGCLGFSPVLDGKNYWVSYLIETKKSGTLTIDMNKPYQVMEIIGTDSENVKDEEIIKEIVEKIKKSKSALLQTWYTSDLTGKQITPTDSAVESIEVFILSDTGSSTASGDVNADGSFNVADLVMMQKFLLGNGTLTDWKAGDLCADKRIDVFDMVRLRQLLAAA